MSCNCGNIERMDFDRIRKMAIKYATTFEEDVQIHSWTQRGFGKLYDFDPLGSVERGKGIVEIIKFRDHKSKNVLRDSKEPKSDSKKAEKPKRSSKRKSGRKNSGSSKKLAGNNEPVGKSEAGDSAKEVAGDS